MYRSEKRYFHSSLPQQRHLRNGRFSVSASTQGGVSKSLEDSAAAALVAPSATVAEFVSAAAPAACCTPAHNATHTITNTSASAARYTVSNFAFTLASVSRQRGNLQAWSDASSPASAR